KEKSFHLAPLKKNRTHTPTQVRANLHANLVVFDRNHAVMLQLRSPAGLAKTLVGIQSIRVVRCGDRTCWDQTMCQYALRVLCEFKHCRAEPFRHRRCSSQERGQNELRGPESFFPWKCQHAARDGHPKEAARAIPTG